MSLHLDRRAVVLGSSPGQTLVGLGEVLEPYLSRSRLSRVRALDAGDHPLASRFGLTLPSSHLPSGPLLAAARRVSPPDRSVVFHLSLLSVDEAGTVHLVSEREAGDTTPMTSQIARLGTKALTPVPGHGIDHLLVWEDGSLDLCCPTPQQVAGSHWQATLPEGDGEARLRRFIEDSLDLLTDLPENRERADQGAPRLNLLWPHSFGFVPRLPNLAIAWGKTVQVVSDDPLVQGIARLTGLKPTAVPPTSGDLLAFVPPVPRAEPGAESELQAYVADKRSQIAQQALARLLPCEPKTAELLVVIEGEPGLAIQYHPEAPLSKQVPFEDEALAEASLPPTTIQGLIGGFFGSA